MTPVYIVNRLKQWAITFLVCDFKVKRQSTTAFGQTDALTRLTGFKIETSEDIVASNVETENLCQTLNDAINGLPVTHEVIEGTTETSRRINNYLLTRWPSYRFEKKHRSTFVDAA